MNESQSPSIQLADIYPELGEAHTPKVTSPNVVQRKWFAPSIGIVLSVFAALLACLTVPSMRTALLDDPNAAFLKPLAAYLNGDTAIAEPVRVADRFDIARSEKTDLSKENEQIANFLSKKYRLASSEVAKFVAIAESVSKSTGLEMTLILAVMSIESNLNPIMESPVGAQGLMQVLTAVHLDKLQAYGGASKVFDPFTNISVGAKILFNCIKLGGSVEMGLKCYVGASGPTDNGYGLKVLAEKERIEKAKFGVLDFSPNNKVLIDLNMIAGPEAPRNDPAQNIKDSIALTQEVANSAANSPTGHTSLPLAEPLSNKPLIPTMLPQAQSDLKQK
jgi:Transglycosylase SLT domain